MTGVVKRRPGLTRPVHRVGGRTVHSLLPRSRVTMPMRECGQKTLLNMPQASLGSYLVAGSADRDLPER